MDRRETPGLQNERTALAWQRTALSLIVATAALARFAYEQVGYVGLLCLVALPLSTFVFYESRARYRRREAGGAPARSRGGIAALALTVCIVVLCLTGLIVVLR